jgi:hypothetical protein
MRPSALIASARAAWFSTRTSTWGSRMETELNLNEKELAHPRKQQLRVGFGIFISKQLCTRLIGASRG